MAEENYLLVKFRRYDIQKNGVLSEVPQDSGFYLGLPSSHDKSPTRFTSLHKDLGDLVKEVVGNGKRINVRGLTTVAPSFDISADAGNGFFICDASQEEIISFVGLYLKEMAMK